MVYEKPVVAGWSMKSFMLLACELDEGGEAYHVAHVAPGVGIVVYVAVVVNVTWS